MALQLAGCLLWESSEALKRFSKLTLKWNKTAECEPCLGWSRCRSFCAAVAGFQGNRTTRSPRLPFLWETFLFRLFFFQCSLWLGSLYLFLETKNGLLQDLRRAWSRSLIMKKFSVQMIKKVRMKWIISCPCLRSQSLRCRTQCARALPWSRTRQLSHAPILISPFPKTVFTGLLPARARETARQHEPLTQNRTVELASLMHTARALQHKHQCTHVNKGYFCAAAPAE